MTIFFISDTHFGHTNVIKYDKRPFSSIEEMNQSIIDNWNRTVMPNDTIYHLGDFAFSSKESIIEILKQLNGKKHFIFGNHDKQMKDQDILKYFDTCQHYVELKHNNETFCLMHYPLAEWNKCHHGSIMIHGHCHGNYTPPTPRKIIDVGAPCINYTPISIDEISLKMKDVSILSHH